MARQLALWVRAASGRATLVYRFNAERVRFDKRILIDGQQRVTALMASLPGSEVLTDDCETVIEIFIRVNPAGAALSQADFAMPKIAVNEAYGGNLLRKAIDCFCQPAVAPGLVRRPGLNSACRNAIRSPPRQRQRLAQPAPPR